ncbi:MAG: PilZ domain-containing protein [Acidobacteriota bacterium]
MRGENRLHPRLLVHMPGEFRPRGVELWAPCTIRDLSAGGATLLTTERIPVQTSVRLRFTLEEEPESAGPIEVETLVLRSGTELAAGGNVRHLAALHFLDLQGHRFERVRRYVFERQGKRATGAMGPAL